MFSRELFGYCDNLQLLFLKFSRKFPVDENLLHEAALVPQYLITRMLSIIFSCDFFHYFQQV